MATAEVSRISSAVHRQYENLPYPTRDPENERQRLLATLLDDLGAINLYCYQGRRDFTSGFRALVAGGGTGDASIYLAHQLKETDATIVHLDLSAAAIDVAQQRAEIRGLNNIEWIEGSLLDLARMGLKSFDYINCSGVLHHLDDPISGLRTLRLALKEDGAFGLMLYGQYGRTGVYQMQELLRRLDTGNTNSQKRTDHARSVLQLLPHTNWYKRSEGLFGLDETADDAELFDRLLHARDRGYTVPEVYELLDNVGLQLTEFAAEFRELYQPSFAVADPQFSHAIQQLSVREQYAVAELYWGAITKHSFWATPTSSSIDLLGEDNVPFFSRLAELNGLRESILNCRGPEWSHRIPLVDGIELTLQIDCTPIAIKFIELIDGQRTMREIVAALAVDPGGVSTAAIRQTCFGIMQTLLKYDLLFVRHISVPPFCTK